MEMQVKGGAAILLLLLGTWVSSTCLAADDLAYDPQGQLRRRQDNYVHFAVRRCMYNVMSGQLQQGVRDSEKITLTGMSVCAGPLVQSLQAQGISPEDVTDYVIRTSQEVLASIPGAQPVPPNPAASGDISRRAEDEFSQNFVCPERFKTEQESKLALTRSAEWYGSHSPTFTEEGFLAFRKRLLRRHACAKSLRNLQEAP